MFKKWIVMIILSTLLALLAIWARPVFAEPGRVDVVEFARKACTRIGMELVPKSIDGTVHAFLCAPASRLHLYRQSRYYISASRLQAESWCQRAFRGKLLSFAPERNIFICEDGRKRTPKQTKT